MINFDEYECCKCHGTIVDHLGSCGICQDCGAIYNEEDVNNGTINLEE